MYKENEKLILLEDLGEKDEPKYIPKHSELIFIKALDHGFQSYVVAQYNDRIITLPEIAVKPKNPGNFLKIRGLYRHTPNRSGDPGRIIYQSVDIGLRKNLTKAFQDFFSPTHTSQPVMN